MAESKAWKLALGEQYHAAVGQRELLHLDQNVIDANAMSQNLLRYHVPLAPAYCNEVLLWQGRFVPLMNLAIRLDHNITHRQATLPYIAIVGYQAARGAPTNYGAFWLAQPPNLVNVNDEQICPLSDAGEGWAALATVCFSDNDTAFPVLDLLRIFSSNAKVATQPPFAKVEAFTRKVKTKSS